MRFASLAALTVTLTCGLACGAAAGVEPSDGAAGGSTGGSAGKPHGGAGGAGDGVAGMGAAGAPSAGAAGTSSAGAAGDTSGGTGGMSSAGAAGATSGGAAGSTTAGAAGAPAGGAAGDPFGGAGAPAGGAAGAGGATGECAGLQAKPEVFGHSAGTLYRLDPDTKAVTTVGPLSGCQIVIDIALDKTGKMYGTTATGFVTIDKSSGKCSAISLGSYPNSLSFVPQGTLDPNVEALVGYNGSDYVRINPSNGNVSVVGALTGGYSSSGDVVSVIGGGTYLTVTGNGCSDCIVQVDPKTGDKVGAPVKLSYGAVYGLAYWGGQAFGFTDGGKLFNFDLVTKTTTEISILNKPSGLSFYGAGSTTCAARGNE